MGTTWVGGAGEEKSNRSPRAADVGAGAAFGAVVFIGGDAIPPKPSGLPMDCFGWWVGAEETGFESKKLPPLKPENDDVLEAGGARDDVNPPILAKASFCGDFTAGGEFAKLKLLNASLRPPKELCGWPMPVGDGIPPPIEPVGACEGA